jgi:hypothetical protein
MDGSLRMPCEGILATMAGAGCFAQSGTPYHIEADDTNSHILGMLEANNLICNVGQSMWVLDDKSSDYISPMFTVEKPFHVFTRRADLPLEDHCNRSINTHTSRISNKPSNVSSTSDASLINRGWPIRSSV